MSLKLLKVRIIPDGLIDKGNAMCWIGKFSFLKGAFTPGVRDSSVESLNTMVVI
jgi:hypothetical protein